MSLVIIAIVLAPSFFWILYFLHMDKYEKEPKKIMIYAFVWGMVSTFVAMFLEMTASKMISSHSVIYFLLIVGPAEEFSKYLVLKYYVYDKSCFDEISDGILYASVVALGFATFENLFYIMHYGVALIFIRGIVSILGHLTFTSFIGIAMIKKKLSGKGTIIYGFLLAAFLHGTFDALLMFKTISTILFIPFFIYISYVYFKNFKRYEVISKIFKNRQDKNSK